MVARTINARFDGYCKTCRQEYLQGSRITRVGPKYWVHEACAATNGNGNAAAHAAHLEAMAPPPVAVIAPPPSAATSQAEIEAIVREVLEGAELSVDEQAIRDVVKVEMAKAGITKHVIEIRLPEAAATVQIEGKVHPEFPRMVRLATARDPFNPTQYARRNILLVGPAGSGKTHLAAQLATALGLRFDFIACSAGMSEGQLTGRLLPTAPTVEEMTERVGLFKAAGFADELAVSLASTATGAFAYNISTFVDMYENGGVFLFDEVDAADANTLLVLNSALSNGHMALPNRPGNSKAYRHADFVCVAAANTWGTGADRQYVGRNQLDEAFLDRFRIGQIEMDYDADVEASLCPDDALRSHLLAIREKCRENKIRRLVSMRFLKDAFIMKFNGDTLANIEKALFSGWTRDELAKVKG